MKEKDYKQMTAAEQLEYIEQLTEFSEKQLPRLCGLKGAWSSDDRRVMQQGLQLIGIFPFARDFADKGLRYGDYSARLGRMAFYVDKVKQEVATGVALRSDDGQQYVYIPQMQQQFRRRGRPTLQEQAQQRMIIANAGQTDVETRRQTAIARLLGLEVVVGQQLREKNNEELRQEREARKAEEAKKNPPLFDSPADHNTTEAAETFEGTGKTQTADMAGTTFLPTIDMGGERVFKLTLNQKAPFLTTHLQQQVANVRTLRGMRADASNSAKLLAEQGKPKEEIEPYNKQAIEAQDALTAIYQSVDNELAVMYYRLQNDGSYREEWLKRYKYRSMDEVLPDLMSDLKKHYRKIADAQPDFDLRMKTLIEQESPEFVARQKAEADRKKEVQDLLRYIRRTDKPLTKTRLTGMQNRMARLRELDPEEAKVQEPILRKAEEDFARMEAEKADGKAEKPSTDGKTEKADGKTDETAKEPSTDAKTDKN